MGVPNPVVLLRRSRYDAFAVAFDVNRGIGDMAHGGIGTETSTGGLNGSGGGGSAAAAAADAAAASPRRARPAMAGPRRPRATRGAADPLDELLAGCPC